MTEQTAGSPDTFADLARYMATPRLGGLALSPDGTRLVTAVSQPGPDGKKYRSALWEIDPAGGREPRRLTRSGKGEAQPVFTPDGALLFVSARPDPTAKEQDEDAPPAVWLLPPGGEARVVAVRPGGVGTLAVARASGDLAVLSEVLPGATSAEEDGAARKARKDAGVSAILHERYPVRCWDRDLGPGQSRVFVADPLRAGVDRYDDPRDLTPEPAGRVDGEWLAVSPDGRLVAYVWNVPDGPDGERQTVVVADTADGDRRIVIDDGEASFYGPAFSPDGRLLACCREGRTSYHEPGRTTLWVVDLETGEGRDATPTLPVWPDRPVFSADSACVFFVADDHGHRPAFRLDLADGSVTRLTASGGYGDLVAAPDGSALYALRGAVDSPPRPVRLDSSATDQEPVYLPSPGDVGELPGTLTEVTTTADDGVPLRAWLCLPREASAAHPAPLLLWIHGGPLASWNTWSWRWNPWLMVARGYAVLLPDPALSTGYGLDFIRRGWAAWGDRPFTDLMAITDATEARDDIDETRSAAMGGSFGGYMANWVATQTDRFRAVVTHASLWNLDQFGGTTDYSFYWAREMGDPLSQPERYQANSPHLRVGSIRTPMLVIHGDKDYRVPIAEALRLWWDLVRFEVPARFLYFPDENHWILTPGNATVWYQTVLAFLAEHVLGEKWERPALL
jgi:dipeptidyl aminopeptidase/acylaminoacyl peptidase